MFIGHLLRTATVTYKWDPQKHSQCTKRWTEYGVSNSAETISLFKLGIT